MKNNILSVLVVGESPNEILKKYDSKETVQEYIKYKYADADKIKQNAEELIDTLIKRNDTLELTSFQFSALKERQKAIKNMSSFEYYQLVTEGLQYDNDGNALSTENPSEKFAQLFKNNESVEPFLLKNGTKTYSAKKKDIDWNKMLSNKLELYNKTWELAFENINPQNDGEEKIKQNMQNNIDYLKSFKDKNEYNKYCSSFWAYAIVDENDWKDVDTFHDDSKKWIENFYKLFIEKIDENKLLTLLGFQHYKNK